MTMILLRRQPARQLAELGRPAAVLATGAIGYVDAAEDDRRRWIAGFGALLDGLDAPLQVADRRIFDAHASLPSRLYAPVQHEKQLRSNQRINQPRQTPP